MTADRLQRVRMEAISPRELAPWLAIDRWEAAVRENLEHATADSMRQFVCRETPGLLHLIVPAET